jgi:protein subunit release factor A
MRGDKIRTVRVKDGIVTDHRNGKKTSFERYASGDFSEL